MHTKTSDSPSKKTKHDGSYRGFQILKSDEEIDQIAMNITSEQFFKEYISRRKPVKLTTNDPSKMVLDLTKFKCDSLVDTLGYEEPLQIEKKYQNGFGSGQARVRLGLEELMGLFSQGHSEYYLTTQYEGDDSDSGEPDSEIDPYLEEEEIVGGLKGDAQSGRMEDPKNSQENSHDLVSESDNDSEEESIDFNNLHDDYEDSGSEHEQSALVDEDLEISQSELQSRLRELFQPPLTNMVKHPETLPVIPDIFGNMIPQQINLWVGQSNSRTSKYRIDTSDPLLGLGKYIPGTGGTSSGLHHDHADNLYVLIAGKKRFTLFSPADAAKLYTVGDIYKVFDSGIIDYEVNEKAPNWKHIRDDGAIIEDIINWKLETSDASTKSLLAELKLEQQRNKPVHTVEKPTPPNFSEIPPGLLHIDEFPDPETRDKLFAFASKHFPSVLKLNRYTVWLEAGEMLYLPAGWFHEVSSFGAKAAKSRESTLEDVHIALNYWFIPPNTTDFNLPYQDTYWKEDWTRTKACIDLASSR